jgi:hypothetical protein
METCLGNGRVAALPRIHVAGATDGAKSGHDSEYLLHGYEVMNNQRICQIREMTQSNFKAMYAQASASARAWWWFVRS